MSKMRDHLVSDGVAKLQGLPVAAANGEAVEYSQYVADLATKQATLTAGEHITIGSGSDTPIVVTSTSSDPTLQVVGTSSGSWGKVNFQLDDIQMAPAPLAGETVEVTDLAGNVWSFEIGQVNSFTGAIELEAGEEPRINGSTSGSNNLSTFSDLTDVAPNSITFVKDGGGDEIDVDTTDFVMQTEKGAANGLATLDGSGLVPASQLPSYVDGVLEYADEASFPGTGETGKIYIAIDTGDVYRWSGSVYVKISDVLSAADVLSLWESESGRDASVDGDKLDLIEPNATADQTASEVPLVDAAGNYVATDVEAALAEVMGVAEGATLTDVHNATGSQIDQFKLVYVSGTHASGKPQVSLADSTSAASMPAIGMVVANIADATDGQIQTSGTVDGLDTSSYAAGDELFVNATGDLTNVKPTGASLIQKFGVVTKSHVSSGSIIIVGAGRSNDVPNIPDGQVWIGNASGVATATTLDDTQIPVVDANTNFTAETLDGVLDELYATATTGIGADTIIQSMMTDDSVGTEELIDGNVTTDKMADLSVTEAKLAAALLAKINAKADRYEETGIDLNSGNSFTATINHGLGHNIVAITVYDSAGSVIPNIAIDKVDSSNLTITSTSEETGVQIVCL